LIDRHKVVAIVPVRGRDLERNGRPLTLAGRPLIAHTLDALRGAELVGRIVVSTDSDRHAAIAREYGAEVPFLRPADLAAAGVGLDDVLRHCLDSLEAQGGALWSHVVVAEVTHPLRPAGLVDRVLQALDEQNLDTVFTAYEERHSFWHFNSYGELEPVEKQIGATRGERPVLYREASGLVLVCRSEILRQGSRFGPRIGVVPVRGLFGLIDLQDEGGLELTEALFRLPENA
jgi:N-acylneuraminate cytidylyltransferase